MKLIPLGILTDSVSGVTGLGRIGRELCNHIHADLSDVFRVGVFGIGGNHTSKVPYPNYPIRNMQNLIPFDLPDLWRDFAGDEKGILFSILNIAWTGWLAQPERLPVGLALRDFLVVGADKPPQMSEQSWRKLSPQMQNIVGKRNEGPFKKWLYCPVDGDLPDGTLGHEAEPILRGFDRVLSYTRYGSRVIEKTLKVPEGSIHNLPHGLDSKVFYPRDRAEARKTFVPRLSNGKSDMEIRDGVILLGAVGTNTFRKDWGLALETCSELLRRGKNVFLWAHTNALGTDSNPQIYWNLLSLAEQFGMAQRVVLTTERLSDEDMAHCLSALDCGLHIGSGEGFGYFGPECLACGVPVVHGDYAGGAEFIPPYMLVDPLGYRLESKWMIRRPVFDPVDWADKVMDMLDWPETDERPSIQKELDWDNLWHRWKRWLLDGVQAQKVVSSEAVDVAAS